MATRTAEQWLRALYDSQWVPTVRLATLLLGGADVAADIAAEALLAVYDVRDRLETHDAAVATWRAEIVHRCRVSQRSNAQLRRSEPTKFMATPDGQEHGDFEKFFRRAEIIDVLQSMVPRQREALVLRYYCEAAPAEVAAVLGLSRRTVEDLIDRGLKALRDELTDRGERWQT